MSEEPQSASLLPTGAATDMTRLGSYGSLQEQVIQLCDPLASTEKTQEAVSEADLATKKFPWLQTMLVSSAIFGMVLVVLVFARETSPWHGFFNRGIQQVLVDLSAAFVFFASSDVIAQTLPAVHVGGRYGRTNDLRLVRLKQVHKLVLLANCSLPRWR